VIPVPPPSQLHPRDAWSSRSRLLVALDRIRRALQLAEHATPSDVADEVEARTASGRLDDRAAGRDPYVVDDSRPVRRGGGL